MVLPLITASLITLFVIGVLYYYFVKTKFGNLNTHVVQTIVALCVSACLILSIHWGNIDFVGQIVYINIASIVAVALLFGPWAGIVTAFIVSAERFFVAAKLFNIAYYTADADVLALLFSGFVAAVLCQLFYRNKKHIIIQGTVTTIILSISFYWFCVLTHLDRIREIQSVFGFSMIVFLLANLVAGFVIFTTCAVIRARVDGHSFKEIATKNIIWYKKDVFACISFWVMTCGLLIYIGFWMFTEYGTNELLSSQITWKYNSEIQSMIALTDRDAREYNSNKIDVLCSYADDRSSRDDLAYFIVDNDNNCLNNVSWFDEKTMQGLFESCDNERPDDAYGWQLSYKEPRYLVVYSYYNNYKIVLAGQVNVEMFLYRYTTLLRITVEVLMLFAVLFVAYLGIKRIVIKNLAKVNDSLNKITRGNLAERIDMCGYQEFDMLSDRINATVGTLKGYIDTEANRYKEEFELAKQIQTSALPNVFPPFPDNKQIDIYAMYQPARQVGGDFYDYYFISENKLVLLIADVSGKGIPAAMFMMRAKTAIRVFASEMGDAAKTLEAVNNHLCENNDAEMFVTAWLGIVDVDSGYMQHSSAGHNSPFILQDNKNRVLLLDTPRSLVLGGIDSVKYKNAEYKFNREEKLFLYTDGVSEANNPKGKLYGEEHLTKVLNDCVKKEPNDVCQTVYDDICLFIESAEQFDDITILTFIYKGEEIRLSKDLYETEISVRSSTSNVNKVTERVQSIVDQSNFPDKFKKHIAVAIDEIYSNIVKYGYKTSDKYVTVRVVIDERNKKKFLKIAFVDIAQRFNPLDESAPDTTLGADEREIGGLGIFMVRQMMDDVFYEYENGVNCLTIVKYY